MVLKPSLQWCPQWGELWGWSVGFLLMVPMVPQYGDETRLIYCSGCVALTVGKEQQVFVGIDAKCVVRAVDLSCNRYG